MVSAAAAAYATADEKVYIGDEAALFEGICNMVRGTRNPNLFLPPAQTAARGAGPAQSCEFCECCELCELWRQLRPVGAAPRRNARRRTD